MISFVGYLVTALLSLVLGLSLGMQLQMLRQRWAWQGTARKAAGTRALRRHARQSELARAAGAEREAQFYADRQNAVVS